MRTLKILIKHVQKLTREAENIRYTCITIGIY